MTIRAENISDVLISTLPELGRLRLTELMSNYQSTIALKRILNGKKARYEDSGETFKFNVIFDTNNSARHVGLGYVVNPSIANVLDNGEMPWRITNWHYAMEEHLIQMNSGQAKIVDLLDAQRKAAAASAVLKFEDTLWRCPTATEYETHPVGIPYYVVKNSTVVSLTAGTKTSGFNGGLPSGYTTVAGLVPNTDCNGRYKNYTDIYVDITEDDLIERLSRAMFFTDFEPIVEGIASYETGDDLGIYLNWNTIRPLERFLRSQNDDVGVDIDPYAGRATLQRTKLTPVIQLLDDTTNPIYLIQWGTFEARRLRNYWMKETPFPGNKNPNQPTTMFVNVECTWNLLCTNRRKNAVLATAATMPDGAGPA